MKKFKFSLQKVLEYRSQVEDAKLTAFSKAVEVFNRRREELDRLSRQVGEYRNRLAEIGIGRVSARELSTYRSYLSHCERQLAMATDWMMEAARSMEEKRRLLVAARRDRRVIERFKEIKRSHYDYDARREETKDLDEIAAQGFLAARRVGGGVS